MINYLLILLISLFILFLVLIFSIIFRDNRIIKISAASVIIVTIITVLLFKKLFMPSFLGTIEFNWDIKLPKPVKIEEIYNSRGGFHGDGDSYYLLHYSQKKSNELISSLNWKKEDVLAYNKAKAFIKGLQVNGCVTDLNFENKPLTIYKRKARSDYVILLYDSINYKLYIIESYR